MKHEGNNFKVSVDMLRKDLQKANKMEQVRAMLKLLKKIVSPHLKEVKEHEFYVKPGEKKRKEEKRKKNNARNAIREPEKEEPKYFEDYLP